MSTRATAPGVKAGRLLKVIPVSVQLPAAPNTSTPWIGVAGRAQAQLGARDAPGDPVDGEAHVASRRPGRAPVARSMRSEFDVPKLTPGVRLLDAGVGLGGERERLGARRERRRAARGTRRPRPARSPSARAAARRTTTRTGASRSPKVCCGRHRQVVARVRDDLLRGGRRDRRAVQQHRRSRGTRRQREVRRPARRAAPCRCGSPRPESVAVRRISRCAGYGWSGRGRPSRRRVRRSVPSRLLVAGAGRRAVRPPRRSSPALPRAARRPPRRWPNRRSRSCRRPSTSCPAAGVVDRRDRLARDRDRERVGVASRRTCRSPAARPCTCRRAGRCAAAACAVESSNCPSPSRSHSWISRSPGVGIARAGGVERDGQRAVARHRIRRRDRRRRLVLRVPGPADALHVGRAVVDPQQVAVRARPRCRAGSLRPARTARPGRAAAARPAPGSIAHMHLRSSSPKNSAPR